MTIAEYVKEHPPTNPDTVFVYDQRVYLVRDGKMIDRIPACGLRPEYVATLERLG